MADATAIGRVDQIQCAALLDVQFDEDADAIGQPRVGAEMLGIAARLRHRLGQASLRRCPAARGPSRRSTHRWTAGSRRTRHRTAPLPRRRRRPPQREPSAPRRARARCRSPRTRTPHPVARRRRRRPAPNPGGSRSRRRRSGRRTSRAASTTPTGCRCGPPRHPCRAWRRSRRTTHAASGRRPTMRSAGSPPVEVCLPTSRIVGQRVSNAVTRSPAWESGRRARRRPRSACS